MAYKRFHIELAIPLDAEGNPPAKLLKPFSLNDLPQNGKGMTRLDVVEFMIRYLKSLSVKVNAGTEREEDTTRAVIHICRHDDGLPCEAEKEI